MKTSPRTTALLTCAVLSVPAAAQSSVTLYGLVDAAVDVSSNGLGTTYRLESGGTYGSRWGLKGAEDLGGGLRALFQLEGGFGVDTGMLQQGGRVFGRHAWVGLDGAWGQLSFGRQLSPQYYSYLYTDAFELGYAGGLQGLTKTGATGTSAFAMSSYVKTGRIDNSLNYATPVMGGFSARAMLGLSESAEGQSHGGVASASLRYSAGPVDLNAGYTRNKDADAAGSWTIWTVGGSFAIGQAKVFLGHTVDRDTSADTAEAAGPHKELRLTNIGVQYRPTDALKLIAQAYRVADRSNDRPGDRDATVLAVGADYSFSKRTAVYASIGTVDNRNGSGYSLGGALFAGTPVASDARAKTLTFGIRHWF